jgi:hypothetical protein
MPKKISPITGAWNFAMTKTNLELKLKARPSEPATLGMISMLDSKFIETCVASIVSTPEAHARHHVSWERGLCLPLELKVVGESLQRKTLSCKSPSLVLLWIMNGENRPSVIDELVEF